jgi:hypothetical protein
MGKRTRRVCGGFPVKKNRFLTGAALLVAVDGNPTGSFVRCDMNEPYRLASNAR